MINKTHLKNFVFLSSAESISGLLFFIAMLFAARMLGPENFGKVTFARSMMLYFLMLVTAGLDFLGIREGARDHSRIRELLENILSLRLVLSVITYIGLFLLLLFYPNDGETRHAVMIYGGLILLSALSIEWVFQSLERMEITAIARLLSEFLFIAIVFLSIRQPKDLLWIPAARVLGTVLQNLYLWIIGLKEYRPIRLRWNISRWTGMLKQSLPMGFGFMMVQVYFYLNSIILGIVGSYESVGIYSAAYRILTSVILVISMLNKALYPSLSRLHHESKEKMAHLLQDALQSVFALTIWIIFHGLILSAWGITLLYGEEYLDSIPLFRILLFDLLFVVINGLLAHSVLASDQEKQYLLSVSIGAVANLGLNLVLIPKYNVTGAAVATILSECFVLLYFAIHFNRMRIPIRWNRLGMILIIGILTGGPILFYKSKISLPGAIAAFNLLYIGILYRTGWLPFGILVNQIRKKFFIRKEI